MALPAGPEGRAGPQGLAGPPGAAGVSDLQTVGAQETGPVSARTVHASCPPGKQVISGGAYAGSGDDGAVLIWGGPSAGGWTARTKHPHPTFNWTLTVYVICGYAVEGHSVKHERSDADN